MSKQDRQGARTVTDLERKYNFERSFAEVMGVATDARTSAEEARKAAQEANDSFSGLDQTAIFNLLTNNGKAQGVYRKGEEIYINASYIGAGQIASQNFKEDYIALVGYSYKKLEPTTYSFSLDGNDYHFVITKAVPFGGSIRFYKSAMSVKTLDASANEIETVIVKNGSMHYHGVGYVLKLDVSVYFSEGGTKFDLENGEIISSQFAIKSDGTAYFGGELEVNFGRVGAFDVSMRNMTATSLVGCATAIGDTGISFYSGVAEERYVDFFAGDPLYIEGLSSRDPHVVEIVNSNGDSLKVTPDTADLTGAWKATPYTHSGENSEVVTKADLMWLGLIPRE